MEDRRCATCHWAEIQNEWQAECRRRAPVVDPQAVTGLRSSTSRGVTEYEHTRGPRTFWPIVDYSHYCGEWELEQSAVPNPNAGTF